MQAQGEAEPPTQAPRPWPTRVRPYLLLLLSAVLMFLGYAGFGIWPLGFIGLVPALFVLDPTQTLGGFERTGRWRFFRRALFFGYVAELGGFFWLTNTLTEFSGFPVVVSLLFASIFFLFQGLQFVAILAAWAKARTMGWPATPALVSAYLASEMLFPMLFEHYYGNATHPVPILMQVADLGGPLMCTALFVLPMGAAYELLSARLVGAAMPRLWPGLALGYVLFAVGYGAFRMQAVPSLDEGAPRIEVGVVQANVGLAEKWADPVGGVRRHVEMSHALEADHPGLDLIIWPESALSFFLPYDIEHLDQWPRARSLGLRSISTPLLFGALRARRGEDGELVERNTAFLADGEGRVLGAYDKIYLLAFGEFLPFGDTFPELYDISPMSGRFSPGEHVEPLLFEGHRITTLICYEDIVSSFVRRAVHEARPELLVNITNDSWFGNTHEPYVHMTLARFRAIEHRLWLVRATTTGVSVIIDPLGRVVAQTGTFEQATLHGEVALREGGGTLYEALGPWPGYLAILAILGMCLRPREKRAMPGDAGRKGQEKPKSN